MDMSRANEFKEIENIQELNKLVGKLVQLYYPKANEYLIGYLKKVELSKRIVDGKRDIVIHLKNGIRRKGIEYDINIYEMIKRKFPKRIYPSIYVPRVRKRSIRYKLMEA
jgi:hypothetical protein